MSKWRAYLHYSNGKTQEFEFSADDSIEAQKKVSSIFPNVTFTLTQID